MERIDSIRVALDPIRTCGTESLPASAVIMITVNGAKADEAHHAEKD